METLALTFEDHLHQPQIEKQIDWLKKALTAIQVTNYCLSYVFLDETEMVELNNRVLNHNYATDIITFDLKDDIDPYDLNAELVICTSVVAFNAIAFKSTFEYEMRRVMIHGVLHLIGFDDKNQASQEKMRKKENELINNL